MEMAWLQAHMSDYPFVQELWLFVSIALVFFMQAGFLCLEAGTVRRKNSVNVALKNFVVELVSTSAFFACGYALMFGASRAGILGAAAPMLLGAADSILPHFLFQAVFCGTAATIISGAVAERLRFLPFVLVSALLSAAIYPVFGHWVWGGGWLSTLGYHDFAGSSVVHLLGAGISLPGVLILGARRGRFDAEGRPVELPGSNLVLSALGAFILFFGWIGFNGGSAPLGEATGRIVAATMVAGCFGGLSSLLVSWTAGGLAQAGFLLNGTLGGLVAVTAGADSYSVQAAAVVGAAAGVVSWAATALLERLRVDDAVGAIPVHGACGLIGILSVPLLARGDLLASHLAATGLAGRWEWLGVQAAGALCCLAWSFGTGWIAWVLVARITPLRISPQAEEIGMNFSEHGVRDLAAEASHG